MTPAEQG